MVVNKKHTVHYSTERRQSQDPEAGFPLLPVFSYKRLASYMTDIYSFIRGTVPSSARVSTAILSYTQL